MKEMSLDIGWVFMLAFCAFYCGAKAGIAWDRYRSNRVDYQKLRAEKESLYKLSQGALHALTQWQERAVIAEDKLKNVEEFSEYIDG
jgi:hypothetical protein